MRQWHLGVAAPNRDLAVSARLTRRCLDNHVFRVRRRSVRNGSVRTDLVSAFPGYVFVDVAGSWHLTRDVLDLVGFVTFGGEAATVPPAVMSRLLDEADEDDVLPASVADDVSFLPGARVRVTDGPLCGYLGQFVRSASSAWALVLVDRLPVKIRLSQLERVESRRSAAQCIGSCNPAAAAA